MAQTIECPNCDVEIVPAEPVEVDESVICDACNHHLSVLTVKDNGEVEVEDMGLVEGSDDEDLEDDVSDDEDDEEDDAADM